MKINKKTLVLILGIILVSTLIFLFLNNQYGLTGNVIKGEYTNPSNITREMAQNALSESVNIIMQMQKQGFSTIYLNDTLLAANIIFSQLDYVEILRNVSSSEKQKQEARNALALVKWQNLSYSDVLIYTNEIKNKEQIAYFLYDKINLQEKNFDSYSETSKSILSQAKLAFSEERYNDSAKLLEDLNLQIEKEKTDSSTLNGLADSAKNIFQKYWLQITFGLLILCLLIFFLSKKLKKELLKKQIKKMKIELRVLDDLIKRTQEQRYKENKISGLVYNIRMKKYESRIQEIKEELPVLESRLNNKK